MNIETNQATPYANLDPGMILSAIESIGIVCSGSLLALNSYENRVYQVGLEEDAPLIAKFYRPQRWSNEAIIEEHQFALELKEHDIPVVAPLVINQHSLHEFNGYRFALFPRQGGRPIELDNVEHLEWIGRFIGRLHAVGATRPFVHRLTLSTSAYGHPFEYLIEHRFIPTELEDRYRDVASTVINQIDHLFQDASATQFIRLHGDCHAGNVLWNQLGPQIVDLDDCLMGPAIQDLWMLIPGGRNREEIRYQLEPILCGYESFHDFDYRELRLIAALRALRLLQYSGWLAKRWEDPAFPQSFPWFNTTRYWQEQIQHLNEQRDLLDEVINCGF